MNTDRVAWSDLVARPYSCKMKTMLVGHHGPRSVIVLHKHALCVAWLEHPRLHPSIVWCDDMRPPNDERWRPPTHGMCGPVAMCEHVVRCVDRVAWGHAPSAVIVVCTAHGSIWLDLARFGSIWLDLARFGSICARFVLDLCRRLARFGSICARFVLDLCQCLARFGSNWLDLA